MGAFDVRIVSHELKEDDNGNMYAKYAIRVTDEVSGHTWVLQRRFREIRRLHKLLRNAYHGVPKCPSRKLFGHSNDRFLQKRKGELEFFLMIIIDLPYVYRHPAGREFFEFEHHMKALSATDESDTEAISQTPVSIDVRILIDTGCICDTHTHWQAGSLEWPAVTALVRKREGRARCLPHTLRLPRF
eukprot:GEMP01056532.1.p1 GENE.GEMP01056532.1~~GEMP01056532.1.p1  ORF type:complete len:187 (+),score=12.17 GEMP01056532.1:166-726(+)